MTKTFPSDGSNFSGLHAAERWLREHGHAYGSMQRDAPIGVHHIEDGGEVHISKWRGLNRRDRARLDGRLESADYKSGAVVLTLTGGPLT